MVVENFQSYFEWLGSNFGIFLLVVGALVLLGLLVGFLSSAIRYGPGEAFYSTARVVGQTVPDVVHSSPRRIWGIARLAIQESIRRRVLLVAFVLFAAVILVGGMFLDTDTAHPHRLYTSSMMFFTWLLIVIMVWLLSTSSLPTDIRNKTIYTVVTKPVRPLEIVLGRMLGFAAVGTLLLTLMGVVSYFFVLRHLSHSHEVDGGVIAVADESQDGETPSDAIRVVAKGETTFDKHHRHTINVLSDGTAYTDTQHEHWHEVTINGEGVNATYEIGSPEGQFQARVPIYGKLSFLDPNGLPTDEGINVGNEWTYREYITGGTSAAGVWTFSGIQEEDFNDALPLEMTMSVFRTLKGDIVTPVRGEYWLQNPSGTVKTDPRPFTSAEYEVKSIKVPRKLSGVKGGQRTSLDLFDDVCPDGEMKLFVRCTDNGQYFGMAQADVYIRAADGHYTFNFFKGFLGIWFQMIIVVGLGVMFSTFLNAAVSMLATSAWVVFGYFGDFVRELGEGKVEGGGPLESTIRLITQQNVMTELGLPKFISAMITGIDWGLVKLMWAVTYMVPNFKTFDVSEAVAKGYNVSFDQIAQNATITAGFVVILAMMGYYCLKTREIAA